jgi:hypothetical protein
MRLLVASIAMAGISVAAHRVAADAPTGRYDPVSMGPGTVFDTMTGLTWQQEVDGSNYTFAAATAFCTSPSLPGMGWRLPTMKELQTLVDERAPSPVIDPIFPTTPAQFFWTSSSDSTDATKVWIVDFMQGGTASQPVSTSKNTFVRCVR